MKEILLSFSSGLFVGILFTFFKLPIPAPSVLSGIIGIFGIYIGSLIMQYFLK